MNSNREKRELAWERLWADHWFGRLFGGGLLLGLCGSAVRGLLSGILGGLGVQSWFDYLGSVVQNRHDLTTPVPNLTSEFVSQACSSTVLMLFFSFIMAGIASYGGAVILKKCLANDEKGWLGEAFAGFKFPFGMMWLQFRYWLICFFWGIAAGIPLGAALALSIPLVKRFAEANLVLAVTAVTAVMSVGVLAMFAIFSVPFYRYRFLWLVKAEHPEWGAGTCIAASRRLMKGNKLKSFKLDCSYWKPITLMLLPPAVLVLAIAARGFLGDYRPILPILVAVCSVATLILFVVVPQYVSVGQGFLYEELKKRVVK